MLYSVNMLRNYQRRNCCKEITENRQIIVRQHREVIISVVIGSVGQPSWIAAPLEIFKITLSRGVAFQLSISFTAVSFTCKISWRTKLQKPRNVQHFLFCDLTPKRKSLMASKFKGRANCTDEAQNKAETREYSYLAPCKSHLFT